MYNPNEFKPYEPQKPTNNMHSMSNFISSSEPYLGIIYAHFIKIIRDIYAKNE